MIVLVSYKHIITNKDLILIIIQRHIKLKIREFKDPI